MDIAKNPRNLALLVKLMNLSHVHAVKNREIGLSHNPSAYLYANRNRDALRDSHLDEIHSYGAILVNDIAI